MSTHALFRCILDTSCVVACARQTVAWSAGNGGCQQGWTPLGFRPRTHLQTDGFQLSRLGGACLVVAGRLAGPTEGGSKPYQLNTLYPCLLPSNPHSPIPTGISSLPTDGAALACTCAHSETNMLQQYITHR